MAQGLLSSSKGWRTYLSEVFAGLCSDFTVSPINSGHRQVSHRVHKRPRKARVLSQQKHHQDSEEPSFFFVQFLVQMQFLIQMDVLRLRAYLHRIQPGRPHRPHHIGFTSSTKISHGLSGQYYIKLKEGQGVCCEVWNRHGTSVSCGVLWTLLCQGYHRNGLGFHHSTYFGQGHRNGVRGFLKNGRKDGKLISLLMIQLIATPIHLLSLDIQNRPGQAFAERVKYIKGIFKHVLLIRMARFLLVYGFGGIINLELRRFMKGVFMNH